MGPRGVCRRPSHCIQFALECPQIMRPTLVPFFPHLGSPARARHSNQTIDQTPTKKIKKKPAHCCCGGQLPGPVCVLPRRVLRSTAGLTPLAPCFAPTVAHPDDDDPSAVEGLPFRVGIVRLRTIPPAGDDDDGCPWPCCPCCCCCWAERRGRR